ncbi:DUF1566 domain-containing protein [Dyella mobilis]|uniref:DUF1566 domain-containing protein n=1 Tax=Dyella mobilis TaxID=1849582 RepID=A0ABS2KLD3_9GAMM|nr:DUF1566 domain-containing protein [Dyella mobilis]MBM7131592.1 DUF1566 domain-containing protein [Dyella mobilis]GLQ96433.1 hypothetical protein GCM10007863_08510 [Dyella mobilis]
MTFIKHKLGADLQPVETGHVIVHNETLGLYESVNAPGFDQRMNDADTDAAVAKLNADSYLGITTWRRPEPWESLTQVKYVDEDVMADRDFYPDMQGAYYWTGQTVPWSTSFVFAVYFDGGSVYDLTRYYRAFCRPVASVPARQ